MSGRARRRDPSHPRLLSRASLHACRPVPAPAASLSSLRQLLADRFPQASRPSGGVLPTGVPSVDDAVGGLPRPALTELVCAEPSAGGHVFLAQLLATLRALPGRVALIDACDQFDPQSFPHEHELDHLLWIRCRTPADALPVADLLARETNLNLVVLDLASVPLFQLKRIPAASWYRLQRAISQTDLAFLALTPAAIVSSAQLRLQLDRPHRLRDLSVERPHLAVDLAVSVERRRLAAHG